MVDEIRSNLEPIAPEDLDTRGKFEEEALKEAPVENDVETVSAPEAVEMKEGAQETAQEKENFYDKILSKVKGSSTSNDDSDSQLINDDAEIVGKEKDVESRIQTLLGIAESKGVVYAVKVARKIEDNYVLDELHDRMLGEEFHKALIQKGFIKEI